MVLDKVGNNAGERGKDKKRYLLYEEGTDRCPPEDRRLRRVFPCRIPLKAPKGPVIEEEKDEREGDKHGLGQKAKDEGTADHKVPFQSGALHVGGICPDGDDPEEGGEHIFTFCHPGDRFHVEGVKGKESGYKGALPEGLCHPVKDEK